MKKIATLTERKSEMEEHGGEVMEEKEEDNNKIMKLSSVLKT